MQCEFATYDEELGDFVQCENSAFNEASVDETNKMDEWVSSRDGQNYDIWLNTVQAHLCDKHNRFVHDKINS